MLYIIEHNMNVPCDICCSYFLICYYVSNCALFIGSFTKEIYNNYKKRKYEILKNKQINVYDDAENLITRSFEHETYNGSGENHIVSLPKIDIPLKKMKITNYTKRSNYKPSERYISMTQSNRLDILYE